MLKFVLNKTFIVGIVGPVIAAVIVFGLNHFFSSPTTPPVEPRTEVKDIEKKPIVKPQEVERPQPVKRSQPEAYQNSTGPQSPNFSNINNSQIELNFSNSNDEKAEK